MLTTEKFFNLLLSMIKNNYKIYFYISALAVIFVFAGCSGSESRLEDEYFIRLGDRVVTVSDFNRAFEIAKGAYPHNAMQDRAAVRDAQVRLLNQMVEELILLERAEELGIQISDNEFEKIVSEIKGDYPDDVFEKILLEYAVPYHSWERGLKVRILMERVVAEELADQVEITPAEIKKYYREHHKNNSEASGQQEMPKELSATIMKQLRRKKVEKVYFTWINKMKENYTIEINNIQWEKIVGS